ncbi:MAG TPA: hypothetical protein VLV15_09145, partial [Dongiaceae bacterium]|nr:hypothetical protein [Dongiaceae bacterium]
PQTAFSATLSALLGLPFLPVSESPPPASVLALPPAAGAALAGEYFASKAAAAHALESSIDARSADNDRLNEVLFGASGSRAGLRLVFALVATLGVLAGALVAWRSIPGVVDRPPALVHLGLALAVPLGLAASAESFIALRGLFPYESKSIALAVAGGLAVVVGVAALIAGRTPRLRALMLRWRASLFFPIIVLLSLPLVNSHWLAPTGYYATLLVVVTLVLGRSAWAGNARESRAALVLPASAGVLLGGPALSAVGPLLLPMVSLVAGGLGVWSLAAVPGRRGRALMVLVCAVLATAWLWRAHAEPMLAGVVLVLFGVAVVAAAWIADRPDAAAVLLIAGSAGLFLVLAADEREALVFMLASIAALAIARVRFDLSSPGALYVAAGTAILVRLVLFFELGDQYAISSIRTAPGMVLVSQGLPLVTVAGVLLLKYALPWFLILGALLPSVAAGGGGVSHLVDLLVLGYVARFALVAAVVDPCRILPNGMDGIIGMYCVSWAELITFGIAAILITVVAGDRSEPVPAARGA